jgi:Ca2+-binding EF-hand superfamily protein
MSYRQHIADFEKRSVLLFAAFTLGTAGAAFAQSTTTRAGSDQETAAMFQQADKNGDKALSREEAQALPGVAEQFKQIDANGDGAVSEAEFMAAMKPK